MISEEREESGRARQPLFGVSCFGFCAGERLLFGLVVLLVPID